MKTGKYRHYKGNFYEVIGVAKHSETEEELVIYRALYGERGLWVRPRQIFMENIEYQGKIQLRFEYVGQEEGILFRRGNRDQEEGAN